ncbi:MAG: ATP-binding protein [Caulobacteraceae bacterium]
MLKTLKGKIMLICIYLTLLIILVGAFSVFNLFRLSKGINGLMTNNYRSVGALNHMLETIERQDSSILLYVNGDKKRGINIFSENTSEFIKWFGIESNNITEDGENEKVELVNTLYMDYIKSFSGIQEVMNLEGEKKARDYYDKNTVPVFNMLKTEIRGLIKINENAMFSSKNKVTQSALQSMYIIVILLIIASLGGLLIAALLTNRLMKPIYQLKRVISLVKAGDINQYAEITTKDEIGELAEEFNNMTRRLQQFERSTVGELMTEKNKSLAIVKNISEPLIVLDKNYRIVLINKAGESLFEIKEEDAVNKHFLEIIRNGKLFNIISELTSEAENKNNNKIVQIQGNERDNYFSIIVTPVKDMEASINGFVVLLRNITALKELERIKADFISTISHEFKTPLTSIMMGTSLMLDGSLGSVNEKQKHLLETIGEDINGLSALVNDLLHLVGLESGESLYQIEACPVNEIINESLKLFQEQADRKNIKISSNDTAGLPYVKTDFEKTVWVLNNLLSNAIKYTDNGGRISIDAFVSHDKMHIAVSDTGIGIPDEYQGKIFEKFVRVENTYAEFGGTGLGLSIAKEIVEAIGGEIWYESKTSCGSVFTFTLLLDIQEGVNEKGISSR